MAAPERKRTPTEKEARSRDDLTHRDAANDEYFDRNVISMDSQHRQSVRNVRRTTSERFKGTRSKQSVSESFKKRGKQKEAAGKRREPGQKTRIASRKSARVKKPGPAARLSKKHYKKKAFARVSGIGAFGAWTGLSIAFVVYIWQFWLSVLSLVGFASEATVKHFAEETWLGKLISYVVDLQEHFPGDSMGYLFWLLEMIIVGMAFFAFYLLFRMRGINPHSTAVAFMITMGCVFLSVLPVTNLFPWIFLWVAYVGFFLKK